jgi:hypothetical protein
MSGQKGDLSALEADQARKGRARSTHRFPPRALIEKSLPSGVKLVDTFISEEGMGMTGRFSLSFDNVAKLSQIRLPAPAGILLQEKTPLEHPFPFDIKDEGSTLLLTMEPITPVGDPTPAPGDMKLSADLQKQMDAAFSGLRVSFRLETPLAVVDHNATRTEGQTLYWEYDREGLEKMTPERRAQGVRVRLKK